jgi:hypothetical protein
MSNAAYPESVRRLIDEGQIVMASGGADEFL